MAALCELQVHTEGVAPRAGKASREEMGLPRPQRRVDLGITESGGGGWRQQHEQRPGGRNVIMGYRETIGRRVSLEHLYLL